MISAHGLECRGFRRGQRCSKGWTSTLVYFITFYAAPSRESSADADLGHIGRRSSLRWRTARATTRFHPEKGKS